MVNLLLEHNIAFDAIRSFLVAIDHAVYSLISVLFQVIFDISNFMLDNEFFDGFYNNIYLILSIIMMFRVMISLLAYLVNPDKVNDGKVGAGKLIQRVMLSLAMLLMIPWFFKTMFRIQNPVLENLIPNLVLGSTTDVSAIKEDSEFGRNMSWKIYSAFFNYDSDCYSDADQKNVNNITEQDDEIFPGVSDKFNATLNDINKYCENNKKIYEYHYTPVLPLLVGGFLLYILLGFAVKIAIRCFKLIVLRFIAPIPIISYMNPESSSSGAFNTWIKTTFKTWLSVFLYVGVVYFVVMLVTKVILGKNGAIYKLFVDISDKGFLRGMLFLIFMILGLFYFAKQFPEFLTKALGLKGDDFKGEFSSMTKPLTYGAAALGSIGAGITAGRASYAADEVNENGHNPLNIAKNIGAGLFGAAGGLATGLQAASGKDANAAKVFDSLAKRNASVMASGAAGGTFFGGIGAGLSGLITGQTDYDRMEAGWKAEEEQLKYDKQKNAERKNIMDRASSKGLESFETSGTVNKSSGPLSKYNGFTANAAEFNAALAAAEAGGAHGKISGYRSAIGTEISEATYNSLSDANKAGFKAVYDDSQGQYFNFNGTEINMEDARLLQHEINDLNIADYAEKSLQGTINDDVIRTADERYASANNGVGVERTFGGSNGLKANYGSTNSDIQRREMDIANQKNSNATQRAKANSNRSRGQ